MSPKRDQKQNNNCLSTITCPNCILYAHQHSQVLRHACRPTEDSGATQVNKMTHKPKCIYTSNHWTTLGELFPGIRGK